MIVHFALHIFSGIVIAGLLRQYFQMVRHMEDFHSQDPAKGIHNQDISFTRRKLKVEGTSVWCSGNDASDRTCHFSNLCFNPSQGKFIFLHSENSIFENYPLDKDNPLLDLSSVADHTGNFLEVDDVPSQAVDKWNVSLITRPSFLVKRFLPDNLLHVMHDDLIPSWWMIKLMMMGRGGINSDLLQLVFVDEHDNGPFWQLYRTLTREKPLTRHELASLYPDTTLCFTEAAAGISRTTTWYQYGFKDPQGPLPHPQFAAPELRAFAQHVMYQRRIPTQPRGDHVVLLSRKDTRLMANENDLAEAIKDAFKSKVHVMAMETHGLTDMIKTVSSARAVVGMHGSLMSLAMFLPPGAAVVELFPYAVNPEKYTPYKTMVEMRGMGLVYKSWACQDPAMTIGYPDRPARTGGIAHLAEELQAQIKGTTEVPPHQCCEDPNWLYHAYQDTTVDVQQVVSILTEGVRGGREAMGAAGQVVYKRYLSPGTVPGITCVVSGSVAKLTWEAPWNFKYLEASNKHYQVFMQAAGQSGFVVNGHATPDTHVQVTDLHAGTTYFAWVRAGVDPQVNSAFGKYVTCSNE